LGLAPVSVFGITVQSLAGHWTASRYATMSVNHYLLPVSDANGHPR
jgi:hypothetical protein